MYKLNLRRVRLTTFSVVKLINVAYSKRVFPDLVIKHTRRMRRIILSLVAFVALLYLSTLSHFREKILNIKCILILSTTSVREISHSKKN